MKNRITSMLIGAVIAALILFGLVDRLSAADNVATQVLTTSVAGVVPACSSPRYVDQIKVSATGGGWSKVYVSVGLPAGGTFDIAQPDMPGVVAELYPQPVAGAVDTFEFPGRPSGSARIDLCSVRIAGNIPGEPVKLYYSWAGTGATPGSLFVLASSGVQQFPQGGVWRTVSNQVEAAQVMRAQVLAGSVTKVYIGHSAVMQGYPEAIGVEMWGQTAGGPQRSGRPEFWTWYSRRLDTTAITSTVDSSGFILATWNRYSVENDPYRTVYHAGTMHVTDVNQQWSTAFPNGVTYARWQVVNGGTKKKIYVGTASMTISPLSGVGKILFPTSANGGHSEFYYAIPWGWTWSVPVTGIYLRAQDSEEQIVRWEAQATGSSTTYAGNSISLETFNLNGSPQQLGYNYPVGSGALTSFEVSNVPGQQGHIYIGKCSTLQYGNPATAGVILQPNTNGKWLSNFQLSFQHLLSAPIDPQYICIAGAPGEQALITKVRQKDPTATGGYGKQPKTYYYPATTIAQRLAGSSTPVDFLQVQPVPGGFCLTDVGTEEMLPRTQPDPSQVGQIKSLWPTNGQGHNDGVADAASIYGGLDLYKFAAFGRCVGDSYLVFGY